MAAVESAPSTIVIFGSSGDLAQRKLIPALLSLKRRGKLGESCAMVGFSRSDSSDEKLRVRTREALRQSDAAGLAESPEWERSAACLKAISGDYRDPAGFLRLREFLEKSERRQAGSGNWLFYLAVPPSIQLDIIANLAASGLTPRGTGCAGCGWRRVIIEKPFGRDLESAARLDAELARHLSEDQIYRMDHYLGKEPVQNILVLRFANGIFEPLWNRQYVSHVILTAAQREGIGARARYYDGAGALRDMVQNHMLQLMALVAMEPPVSFEPDSIRDEKVKALRAVQTMSAEDVAACAVRGQYGAGSLDSRPVPAYREERDVPGNSMTETYAGLKLFIDNWRWSGVPFFLRTGKRLDSDATEIAIRFSHIPHVMFRQLPEKQHSPNQLTLRIQPDEGISLSFGAKAPGTEVRIKPVTMEFSYEKGFRVPPVPAYERLLLDAVRGDQSLFIRSDAIRETWRIVQPVLDAWKKRPALDFPNYPAGSPGPAAVDSLLGRRKDR